MKRTMHLVDVFGEAPLEGNPLAVVTEAEDLEPERMLQITRWFNLSETTFLLPATHPDADYRVRIFTLAGELPFAGHPTLGTCHVWAVGSGSSAGRFVQECGAGLIPLRRSEGLFWLKAPPLIREGPVDAALVRRIADVLRVDERSILATSWIDNGPGWVGVLMQDAESVLEIEPDMTEASGLDVGVVGFYPEGSPTSYEVRAFFTDHRGGLVEDPVTGSLNASIAQWMIGEGRLSPPYRASQGRRLGRSGLIHVDQDDEGIWVGGATHTVARGDLRL